MVERPQNIPSKLGKLFEHFQKRVNRLENSEGRFARKFHTVSVLAQLHCPFLDACSVMVFRLTLFSVLTRSLNRKQSSQKIQLLDTEKKAPSCCFSIDEKQRISKKKDLRA